MYLIYIQVPPKGGIYRSYLNNVIIKQQPEAMTLHDGDVMPSVWATNTHSYRDSV